MKCPKCGYNSFDYLTACKKCGSALSPYSAYLPIIPSKIEIDNSQSINADSISDPQSGMILNDESNHEANSEQNYIHTPGSTHSHAELTQDFFISEPPTVSKDNQKEFVSSIPTSGSITEINKLFGYESVDTGGKSDIMTELISEDVPKQELIDDNIDSDSRDPYSDNSDQDLVYAAHMIHPEVLPFNLAVLSARAVAFFIDLAIIFAITLVTLLSGLYILGDTSNIYSQQRVIFPLFLILFFLASSYFVILHGFGGRTIGKMSMGISLITSDGQALGLWQAFVRWIGYYISAAFLCLGFIWSVFDSEFQTWHDKLAGTYVIKDRNL